LQGQVQFVLQMSLGQYPQGYSEPFLHIHTYDIHIYI
jgi:hypothetical protein